MYQHPTRTGHTGHWIMDMTGGEKETIWEK